MDYELHCMMSRTKIEQLETYGDLHFFLHLIFLFFCPNRRFIKRTSKHMAMLIQIKQSI